MVFCLPRELKSVTITAVFIPPQANARLALERLHFSISLNGRGH